MVVIYRYFYFLVNVLYSLKKIGITYLHLIWQVYSLECEITRNNKIVVCTCMRYTQVPARPIYALILINFYQV